MNREVKADVSGKERVGALCLAVISGLLLSLAAAVSSQESGVESAQADMGFVEFFRQLVDENHEAYAAKRVEAYTIFCARHDLDPEDRENRESFHKLSFLHQLLTCRAPVDCDRSGVLEIPYMWHWIDPNPRHAIRRRSNGERLEDESPPARFARYQSFADVDRVPSVYLADLVTAEPQYEHPECGPMFTFGWCSEREMAFCLLAGFFGHDGWVRQAGNHVWSVFPVQWLTRGGGQKELLLEFDNTYDIFGGQELPPGKSFQQWRQESQLTREQRWYNARVRDPQEMERVRRVRVPPEAQQRIRSQVQAALQSMERGH